jgi:hypothetical protein
MWMEDGSVCRSINAIICEAIDSEGDCEADASCFWLKRSGTVPVKQCVEKVFIDSYLLQIIFSNLFVHFLSLLSQL